MNECPVCNIVHSNKTYCSNKCKNDAKHLGIYYSPEGKVRIRESKLGNKNVSKRPEVRKKISESKIELIPWNKGKSGAQKGVKGKNHPCWKGDRVGYKVLHKWIRREKGVPVSCSQKDKTCRGRIEWANRSKEYKRDLDDWISLCISHHRRYDRVGFLIKGSIKDNYDEGYHRKLSNLPDGYPLVEDCVTC